MTIPRVVLAFVLLALVYFSCAIETSVGGRTMMPHGPAVVLVLAAWWLSATPAVLIAGGIGLVCDALGAGVIGPGMVAAVVTVFVATVLKQRWEFSSVLSAALFSMGVAAGWMTGGLWLASVMSPVVLEECDVKLAVARGMATALAALAILVLVKGAQRVASGLAAVLLAH